MARYVTVGSVSHRPSYPYEAVDERLKEAESFVVRAARMGADIVCFPEFYIQIGMPPERWLQLAEPVGGKGIAYMAEVARSNSLYIIWSLFLREGKHVYLASVLLDRQGGIAGIYRKMYPDLTQLEYGIRPGLDAPVFETDFGRIGLSICFDLNFRPIMEGLALNGAEIIFFSSLYRGGLQLRAWAHELRVYMVSAIGGELGQVVDMSGEVLAESTYESVLVQRLNLDRVFLHMDNNWDKMDAMLAKYGKGLRFQYYTREGKYTISSEMPDRSVAEIVTEFGLEDQDSFFARATRMRADALARD